jgi:hypothetical protein
MTTPAPVARPVIDLPDVIPMDPMPVAAVLFGVIGLLGNLFAPLAVMAGIVALWPVCRRRGSKRSDGLAVAGLVLGGVGVALLLGTHPWVS